MGLGEDGEARVRGLGEDGEARVRGARRRWGGQGTWG